jgi:hypothetical protein
MFIALIVLRIATEISQSQQEKKYQYLVEG